MSKNSPTKSAPNDEYGLVQSCRGLHSAMDELDALMAEKVGISRNDLRCLNLLEHGGMLPKDIGKKLELTSGSVTALLDRLEKRKFIKRKPHPEDRRAILVELTPLVFKELGELYKKMGLAVVDLSNHYGKNEAKKAASHINDLAMTINNLIKELK